MKKIFNIVFLFTTLLLFSVGCKFNMQQPETTDNGKVKISVSTKFDENSRKAYIDSTELAKYYQQLTYTMTATDSKQNTIKVFEDKSYADLSKYSGEFNPGLWTFTMSGFDAVSKKQILSGVCQVELVSESKKLEFYMKPVSGTEGKVEIDVYYSSYYVSSIDGKEGVPEITLTYRTISASGLSESIAFGEELKVIGKDAVLSENIYVNSYEVSLPVEKYLISAAISYTNKDGKKINEHIGDDLVYVSPNQTVFEGFRAVRSLNFVRNQWGDETQYNYATGVMIVDYDDTFTTPLVKDQCMKVELSGYPSADFEGNLSFGFADLSNNSWKDIGNGIIPVSLKADEFFTLEFYLCVTQNAASLEGCQLGLAYEASDRDNTLSFENFEISFDSEPEVSVYSYYIGSYHESVAVPVGTDYTLWTSLPYTYNNYDCGYEILGWYDNEDFEGDPITSISAEDNTENKCFYGKYALVFVKNPNNVSTNYVLNLNYDMLGFEKPVQGDVVTLKLRMKSPVTLDNVGFSCDFKHETGEWTRVTTLWNPYNLEEGEDFILNVTLLLPDDFDPSNKTGLGWTLSYDRKDLARELTITDWSIEDYDHYQIGSHFENAHISADATQDGIDFTITRTESDSRWTSVCLRQIDLSDGAEINIAYEFNHDIDETVEYTINYPYVNADENAYFEFTYFQDNKNSEGNSWYREYAAIKPTGGSGVFDLSGLGIERIILSDDDSDQEHRYMTIHGLDDEKVKTTFAGLDNVQFCYQVWAGDGLSDSGDDDWVCGTDSIIYYEDYEYNDYRLLVENPNHQIDIAEAADEYHLDLLKDEKYKHSYWARIWFKVKYDENGVFKTADISSDVTPYIPVGETCIVTFMVDGEVYSQKRILANTVVSEIPEPSKSSADFIGWFYDAEGNVEYSGEKLSADTTLYAVWYIHPLNMTINFPVFENLPPEDVFLNFDTTYLELGDVIDITPNLDESITLESITWFVGINAVDCTERTFEFDSSDYFYLAGDSTPVYFEGCDTNGQKYVGGCNIIICE